MKIAAFNVENLFGRANIFNNESADNSTDVLKNVAELNGLFEKPIYSGNDKARMLELFELLEFNGFYEGPFALIHRIRGRIFKRSNKNGVEVGWRVVPHLLLMSKVRSDQDLTPCADDDASDVAAVLLAIADDIKQITEVERPKITIRFVLFNAEKYGLVGSKVYARNQTFFDAPIVGVFQMYMLPLFV